MMSSHKQLTPTGKKKKKLTKGQEKSLGLKTCTEGLGAKWRFSLGEIPSPERAQWAGCRSSKRGPSSQTAPGGFLRSRRGRSRESKVQNKLAKMERDGVLEKSFSLPPTSSPECGLSSQRLMHLRRGRLKILEHDICICYTVTLLCVAEIGFSKGYWDFSASAAG